MDIWTVLTIMFFVVLIVAILAAAFFVDGPSNDELADAAINGADALIAELEETDALIRRVRLVVAEGVEVHASATITITEVAEQLGDAVENLEAARRSVPAWELGVGRG